MKNSAFKIIVFCTRILIVWLLVYSSFSPPSIKQVAAAPMVLSAIPETIAPKDTDIIYSTSATPRAIPTFTWKPVASALTYRIQISSSIGFDTNGILYNVVTPNTTYVPHDTNLPNNSSLYWRVRVEKFQDNSIGVYSFPVQFQKDWLKTGPTTQNMPALLVPPDGAEFAFEDPAIPGERPSFSWTPVPGATHYKLQFSLNEDFNVLAANYETLSTSYQLTQKLVDTTYHWRVIPVQTAKPSALEGRASEIRVVKFNYNTAYVPQPISPENGSTPVFTPTFRWNSVRGAEKYILQYSTSDVFASSVTTITTYTNNYTPIVPLPNDVNYYWRVRVESGNSKTPIWSSVWSFRKVWYLKPQLLTPTEGFAYTNEPIFSWTPVEGATRYLIEMSDNNSFSSIKYQISTVSNSFFIREAQYNCPPYSSAINNVFWRVTPYDANGNKGLVSDPRNFACDITAGAPVQVYPRYYYPPHDSAKLNPSDDMTVPLPIFHWKRLLQQPGGGSSPQSAGYRIIISASPTFSPVDWSFTTKNMNAVPINAVLAPGVQYYWKVRPIDGGGSDIGQWSQTWIARFNPDLLPAATSSIQPMRPAHGSEWTETVPLFEWRKLQNAASYQIQISTSPDPASFTIPAYLVKQDNTIYPAYSFSDTLKFGTYYWRIRGLTSGGTPIGPNDGWSSLQRFQVAAQSRWLSVRTVGQNGATVIAEDPANDINDPNYDLRTLAITQDSDSWYFGFHANTSAIDMRYMLYIDIDHKDNSGATNNPEGYLVNTIPAHRPEYAVSIRQVNGVFSRENTWIYRWNKDTSNWNVPNALIDLVGGDVSYNSDTKYLELKIKGPNIGMGDEASTMAVSLFSLMGVSGHAQDTVPADPNVVYSAPDSGQTTTTLSRFSSVSDRLAAIYAPHTPPSDPVTHWTIPPLTWHAPVDVPIHSYGLRIARDAALTSWVRNNVTAIPQSSFNFLFDLEGDNTYYWQVRTFYTPAYGGGWSEPSAFVRKAPGAKGLSVTIENNMPSFSWTRSEGAESYLLQVANNPDFNSNSAFYQVTVKDLNFHTPTNKAFQNGVIHYWRVRPNQYQSVADGWSDVKTFVINRQPPQGLYTIPVTVPNKAMPVMPTLCWGQVATAFRYKIEIAYDSEFKSPYLSPAVVTEQNCYTLMKAGRDGTFFWRVSMVDGLGVESMPSAAQSYTKQYPAPTPISPSGFAAETPLFHWSGVNGADKYHLQILHPQTRVPIYEQKYTAATQHMPLKNLMKDYKVSAYYWRVAMIDKEGNTGPFSDEVLITDSKFYVYLPMIRK
jgi:hypothetical protein